MSKFLFFSYSFTVGCTAVYLLPTFDDRMTNAFGDIMCCSIQQLNMKQEWLKYLYISVTCGSATNANPTLLSVVTSISTRL